MVDTFDAAAYHRERVAREQAEKRIAELQEANGRIQRDLGTAQAALCGASKVLSEGGDLLEAHGWLTRQEAYSRAFGWRRSLEARAVQAEKRVEELEAENKRRFAALRYLAVRAKVATGVPADALDAAESWVLRETGYDMPGDGRDVLRCLAETKEALEAARSRAERAERERDEHKANEEFAREMLDRVVIQGGAESWTTREMRDWCCDCKDFKNGYPVSFIRAHADHANCGHRERDGQDEPADRWVHRKIERERDEARAKANRWDLLDSLLQREGASVEIHHHNPDFGGDANVVTYRYLLDGTQVDYRGESVEDCLRQIVAALSQREEEGRG